MDSEKTILLWRINALHAELSDEREVRRKERQFHIDSEQRHHSEAERLLKDAHDKSTLLCQAEAKIATLQALVDEHIDHRHKLETQLRNAKNQINRQNKEIARMIPSLVLVEQSTLQFSEGKVETFALVVEDVRGRCAGGAAEVLSPVFHSKLYGYSFRLKCRLDAKRLGLGVNLVRGADDDNCEWPFPLKCAFQVVNASGECAESLVIDATKQTDPTLLLGFHRPTELASRKAFGFASVIEWTGDGVPTDKHVFGLDTLCVNDSIQVQVKMWAG